MLVNLLVLFYKWDLAKERVCFLSFTEIAFSILATLFIVLVKKGVGKREVFGKEILYTCTLIFIEISISSIFGHRI